jgi:hypothetical protein
LSSERSSASSPARRLTFLLLAAVALLPAVAEAWPAIQDATGIVYPCDTRPSQLSGGLWSCRSAGGTYAGALVEVARPETRPDLRPWDMGSTPYRYLPYPWGPPPREPSGYDALDPWLGRGSGGSER